MTDICHFTFICFSCQRDFRTLSFFYLVIIIFGKTGSFCYVIENGVITKKDITTGISSDEYVEVLDGIQEGDEVIRDLGSLEEGMQAEPVDASGDAGSVDAGALEGSDSEAAVAKQKKVSDGRFI